MKRERFRHYITRLQPRFLPRESGDTQYGIIDRMENNIIGVRFTKVGKIYHFDTSAVPDVGLGEHVIVDTSRGRHLGEVVQIVKEAPNYRVS